jgi:hypothetical protein
MIVLACSLWGDKDKYCQGAIRAARAVPQISQASRVPLQMWVYHDNTVPKRVLQTLKKLDCKVTHVSARRAAWKGERRAMWRFLAMGDARAVYLIDADMSTEIMLTPRVLKTLREMHSAPKTCCQIWTWRPTWRHQSTYCIPACFTGVVTPSPTKIAGALEHFQATHKPLTFGEGSLPPNRPRYGNGYGLDEWFLRFRWLNILRKQHNMNVRVKMVDYMSIR